MERAYPAYMVNMAMSHFPDAILHAQEMNRSPELSNRMQHDYYLHSLRAKKRFAKWHKAEADDTVQLIAEAYNINIQRAREYKSLLSDDDINAIKTLRSKGGRE